MSKRPLPAPPPQPAPQPAPQPGPQPAPQPGPQPGPQPAPQPASRPAPLPARLSESEKITINLGFVDLGQIELLVREGFYSNRSDFIRTAIRNQIDRHADTVRTLVTRNSVDLGLRHITTADLLAARAAGQRLEIRVLGLAVIAPDVDPTLARETIAALTVLGALQASDAVRAALADRIA